MRCHHRVLERGQHTQLDLVFAGEFHRPDLQHLRAEARHLEHLLEGDGVEPPRFGHDPRIGRIHAVDVGVDLALVGLERRGQRDAGGIGTAAPERGDVLFGVDPLKAGDDDDGPGLEVGAHVLLVDAEDARLGERVVGQDAHLPAGVALGLVAHFLERDREQSDRHLLAGGRDDVELPWIGVGRELLGERQQAVGLAGHRRHDDDELVTLAMEARHAARHVLDAIGGADGGAAVFLDDQGHLRFFAAGKVCIGRGFRARGIRASRWCRRSRTSSTSRRGASSGGR